jgi:hypothetical protein
VIKNKEAGYIRLSDFGIGLQNVRLVLSGQELEQLLKEAAASPIVR